jgi:hypothetical protein
MGLGEERDDLGLEHPSRFAVDDHQLDDGDEQPVGEGAKAGTEWGSRAGSHDERGYGQLSIQGPAGRADRVSGTYRLEAPANQLLRELAAAVSVGNLDPGSLDPDKVLARPG